MVAECPFSVVAGEGVPSMPSADRARPVPEMQFGAKRTELGVMARYGSIETVK